MTDCLFCKIIEGEIPSKRVYEDKDCYAFEDISPAAPVHILIIPKKHSASLNEAEDEKLLGHLMMVAKDLAKEMQIDESGYRLVLNCGEDGGQSVAHLHLHLLGGRALGWPPG